MWQIKYQHDFLDLEPDQSVEIERNSPLFLIDNLLAEYSTPINFVYSDKNSRLLGHYFFDLTIKQKKTLDVEIYDDGSFKCLATLVIESAGMNRLYSGRSNVSGYILTGISNFFTAIKDKLLTALTLGGERSFNFTTFVPTDGSSGFWQHAQGTWAFNNDYVFVPFLNDQYGTGATTWDPELWNNGGKVNFLDNNGNINPYQVVVPWPKLEYILNQVFLENGWNLDTSGLNDTTWKRLLLYNVYTISTTKFNYTITPGFPPVITLTPVGIPIIKVNLAKAMPQNVTCSNFIFEVCKKYGWIPVCDQKTKTCKLISLKEVGKKVPKDWSSYAAPNLVSTFQKEARTFSFKNTFEGEDSISSAKSFDGWVMAEPLNSYYDLPAVSPDHDNTLFFCYLENTYFYQLYDSDIGNRKWAAYADNIYDEEIEDATDTFETKVSTLPTIKDRYRTSPSDIYGLVPYVSQARHSTWGMRTVLYHGLVDSFDEDGHADSHHYPYAGNSHTSYTGDSVYPWSNVLKHLDDDGDDHGIINYWFGNWMNLLNSTEDEVVHIFRLPIVELLQYEWDDVILVNQIPYFGKTMIEKPSADGYGTVQFTMQRINIGA